MRCCVLFKIKPFIFKGLTSVHFFIFKFYYNYYCLLNNYLYICRYSCGGYK